MENLREAPWVLYFGICFQAPQKNKYHQKFLKKLMSILFPQINAWKKSVLQNDIFGLLKKQLNIPITIIDTLN